MNHKATASITDGTTTNVPLLNDEGVPSFNAISANLSLNVTPTVANSGFISLVVSIANNQPGVSQGDQIVVDASGIDTTVLVKSGSTLVLGGIYQYFLKKSRSGIPLLMDLPFVGPLFRNASNQRNRNELLIFITPRILDVGIDEDEELEDEGIVL